MLKKTIGLSDIEWFDDHLKNKVNVIKTCKNPETMATERAPIKL